MSLLPLPADEATRLNECEQTIAKGLRNFVDVGTALLEVQQYRLYRATHSTFAAYCKERWGMAKSQAYRVMESAQIVGFLPVKAGEEAPLKVQSSTDDLSPMGDTQKTLPTPANERSIRPLSKIPKEKVAETYQRAVEIAGGEAPTAAQTEQAVEELNEEEDPTVIVEDDQEEEAEPEEENEFIEEPKPVESMAMMHAEAAIERLRCIDKKDPKWMKAFAVVRQFLNNTEFEWEAQ